MVLLISAILWFAVPTAPADDAIDYNRDIRPILSEHCYQCHGPDENHRQGGLRLDQQESAMGEADSGELAVVPGKPEESELVRRIHSDDADQIMPPADSNKELTDQQIQLLQKWIQQGAAWREHWAFVAPRRPVEPQLDSAWPQNPVDRFILDRLRGEELQPSSTASRETLIRRVTFDLTGLPPTLDEIRVFLADSSPQAYERLVDRLLASPHYGEHMARFWLDAARYGDTHGLHLDNYREMWLYRDWVVRAFNANMPFNQFTIEQLAGDLLDGSTQDQKIASGFNRCHVTTSEGGSIKEEVYVRNVKDRVSTTGTVFMALTLECTSCHDHKYDPLTMKDYYSLFAFFNSLDGAALDGNRKEHAPFVRVHDDESQSQLDGIQSRIVDADKQVREQLTQFNYQDPGMPEGDLADRKDFVWFDDAIPQGGQAMGDWNWVGQPAPVFSGKFSSSRTASGLGQHYFVHADSPLAVGEGDVLFAYVYLDPANPPTQIMVQWNIGDWEHRAYWGEDHIEWGKDGTPSRRSMGPLPETGTWTRLEVPAKKVDLKKLDAIGGFAFSQVDGTVWWDRAGINSTAAAQHASESLAAWRQTQPSVAKTGLPEDIAKLVQLVPKSLGVKQKERLRDYYVEHVWSKTRNAMKPLHKLRGEAKQQFSELEKKSPLSLVFKESSQPRAAYLLKRGEYDQRGEQVQRATPTVLPPLPDDLPRNRLGLANWLVDPKHPLLARVTVNRFWQQLFGTGIVKTSEDFGSQGEVPSHPELLDWLAVQFIADDWDVKKMMKRFVMSAT
ncbi:MAG: PSD1 and planctomycete cytochrome C domain-containing protein, partial [Planctomycetales bacterium]